MNWSDIDWLIDLSVFGGDSLNRKRKSVRGMEKTSEVIALGLHGLFTSPSFSWEYIGSQSQLGFIFHSLYSQFLTQFYSISFIFSFFFLILFIILFFFFGMETNLKFHLFTLLYFTFFEQFQFICFLLNVVFQVIWMNWMNFLLIVWLNIGL